MTRHAPTRYLRDQLTSGRKDIQIDNIDLAYHKLLPCDREEADLVRHMATHARVPSDYADAYQRWLYHTRGVRGRAVGRRGLVFESQSRLLVGMGEDAPTENSLSLHPVYGVPIIPGSALKGITRAWCAQQLADDPNWGPDSAAFRDIFGVAPENDPDGGLSGGVHFLDAWWLPLGPNYNAPWVAEILTPHNSNYYQKGANPDGTDDPIPIVFLAAQGTFRVVIEGPDAWLDRALEMVTHALADHGVGAKTRGGYGRLKPTNAFPDVVCRAVRAVQNRCKDHHIALLFDAASSPVEQIELLSDRYNRTELTRALVFWSSDHIDAVKDKRLNNYVAAFDLSDETTQAAIREHLAQDEAFLSELGQSNKAGERAKAFAEQVGFEAPAPSGDEAVQKRRDQAGNDPEELRKLIEEIHEGMECSPELYAQLHKALDKSFKTTSKRKKWKNTKRNEWETFIKGTRNRE